MDKVRIKEIKSIKFIKPQKSYIDLPIDIPLTGNWRIVDYAFEVSDYFHFEPGLKYSKNVYSIYLEHDLRKFLNDLMLDSGIYEELRIEIKETRQHGKVMVFKKGFSGRFTTGQIIRENNQTVFLLYNLLGSRGVESVYIHGAWEVFI